jgi:hypothetical protein
MVAHDRSGWKGDKRLRSAFSQLPLDPVADIEMRWQLLNFRTCLSLLEAMQRRDAEGELMEDLVISSYS